MSRFVETLERWNAEPMDGQRLLAMLADTRVTDSRLRGPDARCTFTLFLEREGAGQRSVSAACDRLLASRRPVRDDRESADARGPGSGHDALPL